MHLRIDDGALGRLRNDLLRHQRSADGQRGTEQFPT